MQSLPLKHLLETLKDQPSKQYCQLHIFISQSQLQLQRTASTKLRTSLLNASIFLFSAWGFSSVPRCREALRCEGVNALGAALRLWGCRSWWTMPQPLQQPQPLWSWFWGVLDTVSQEVPSRMELRFPIEVTHLLMYSLGFSSFSVAFSPLHHLCFWNHSP